MGFPELIHAIGEHAVQQREAILSRAGEEARTILRQAESRLPDALRDAKARAEAQAREEASRILSRARLAARREVQAARQRVIERALRALLERLGWLRSTPAYPAIVERLLAECLAEAADPVLVRCRREDRAAVEDAARRLGRAIAVEEADLPLGGVETASGPEGRLVCRNSLGDRMERARPLLLQEAGRCLFGRPGGSAAP